MSIHRLGILAGSVRRRKLTRTSKGRAIVSQACGVDRMLARFPILSVLSCWMKNNSTHITGNPAVYPGCVL